MIIIAVCFIISKSFLALINFATNGNSIMSNSIRQAILNIIYSSQKLYFLAELFCAFEV